MSALNITAIQGIHRLLPALYDVTTGPAYAGPDANSLILLPRYKSVINVATSQPVAVVGEGYTFMTHVEALNIFSEAILASGAEARLRSFRCSGPGTRLACWIDFPGISINDPASGELSLSIVFRNGIDGSSALLLRVGAFRWVCLNMNVSGKRIVDTYMRHTARVHDRLEGAVKRIQQSLEGGAELLEQTFAPLWTQLTGITPALVLDYLVLRHKVPAKYIAGIEHTTDAWALYNGVTNLITRGAASLDTQATYLEKTYRGVCEAIARPDEVASVVEELRVHYTAQRDVSVVDVEFTAKDSSDVDLN